ncbi:GNAT family N-acetyltransferase [Kiritimatiellota bacterium B12222]|nr:GNAT family N-acetyltransferase [Kiritimatiellota bacterium B12222]
MKIRPFQVEDITAMVDMGQRARTKVPAMSREGLAEEMCTHLSPDPEAMKREKILAHVEKYPGWTWVCEHEGELVAFITFILNQRQGVGKIIHHAVDPESGQKGLGQLMYAAVLDFFKEQGLSLCQSADGA